MSSDRGRQAAPTATGAAPTQQVDVARSCQNARSRLLASGVSPSQWMATDLANHALPRRPSKEREAPGVFPPARSWRQLVRHGVCEGAAVGTTSAADRLWYTRRSWPSFRALPAMPMSTHDVGGHLRTFRANRRRPPCARPASGGTSALAMLVTRCRSLARSRPSEPGAQ